MRKWDAREKRKKERRKERKKVGKQHRKGDQERVGRPFDGGCSVWVAYLACCGNCVSGVRCLDLILTEIRGRSQVDHCSETEVGGE